MTECCVGLVVGVYLSMVSLESSELLSVLAVYCDRHISDTSKIGSKLMANAI